MVCFRNILVNLPPKVMMMMIMIMIMMMIIIIIIIIIITIIIINFLCCIFVWEKLVVCVQVLTVSNMIQPFRYLL